MINNSQVRGRIVKYLSKAFERRNTNYYQVENEHQKSYIELFKHTFTKSRTIIKMVNTNLQF